MTDYETYNDEELLGFLKKRDKAAFSEIYRRYWPLLFRHARKLLADEQEAQDVVQDTFIGLWSAAETLPSYALLPSYLYSSIKNKVLNIFRHQKIASAHMESLDTFVGSDSNITDHLVREKLLSKLIEDEIQRLPPRMREVFELKRKSNLSYKEIADAMEISELTVKTQMNKAIIVLRNKFGNNLSAFLPFL